MYQNNIDKLGFKWIDVTLGLKYLNGNILLYLRVLENFFYRYASLQWEHLTQEEFKETVHSVKGLSSTLGMRQLAKASERLHKHKDSHYIEPFHQALSDTLNELQHLVAAVNRSSSETMILILEEDIEIIDTMVEILGDQYDVLVALEYENAIEILEEEPISLLVTSLEMAHLVYFHPIRTLLEESQLVYLVDDLNQLEEREQNSCYITKPLQEDELKKCIETQLKLKNIFKNKFNN